MKENEVSSRNDIPIFDMTNFFSWRSKMKAYLKMFGIWEIVINGNHIHHTLPPMKAFAATNEGFCNHYSCRLKKAIGHNVYTKRGGESV